MSHAFRRPANVSRTTFFTSALVAALFCFVVTAVAIPSEVVGATSTKATLCGVNLRTSDRVSARLRVSIKKGTKVSVTATLTGGSWHAICAGKSVRGRSWVRISAINGKSVKSSYGVTYLYAAAGMFKSVAVPVTRYAACTVNLRTGPAATAAAKTTIQLDAKVTVVLAVTGTSYSTTCAGKPAAGTAWFRITAINGTSVSSLYGVPFVYGAAALFKTTAPDVIAVVTPTPTPTPTPIATPSPTPNPNIAEGIDVSNWQATINWTAVAAAGKRFSYIKASESTDYVDPYYVQNRVQARAAGLYVGAYHFAQPNATVGDAVAEADHFIDTATPASGDMFPVLDLERSGGLASPVLIAWVQAYMGRILERTGVHGVIYCSPNFWKTYMADTTWFALNGYDVLWIAHWTSAGSPTVPGGVWGGNGWTFWQYTSDGAVPGISGRVDLNRYNGTDFTRVLMP